MKQKKTLLVIDDKDQMREIESIQEDLDGKFEIEWEGIRTSQPNFRISATNNNPDIKKITKQIDSAFEKFRHFDLILTDFDLNAKNYVDGLDLIDYIKEKRPKSKIMMYSGNYTDAVRKLIGNPSDTLSELDIAKAVSKFIKYELVDCIDRTSYKDRVIEYFKKESKVSITEELAKLMHEHGDMTFNSCCPKYKGKKFSDIAKEIENGNNSYTDEWVKAMINQTIAYLVEVNDL